MRSVTTRMIATLIGIAIAAGAAWMALRPRPIPVDVAVVSHGPLRVTVDEEGKTRVRDRYVVASPADGRLLRLALKEGDPVDQGRPGRPAGRAIAVASATATADRPRRSATAGGARRGASVLTAAKRRARRAATLERR